MTTGRAARREKLRRRGLSRVRNRDCITIRHTCILDVVSYHVFIVLHTTWDVPGMRLVGCEY